MGATDWDATGAREPDYDTDPQRWRSWKPPLDVHQLVAAKLTGPVLDVGCGEGRLASELGEGVEWVGADASPTQLGTNPHRPLVLADMRALPFREGAFAEVAHLWCLYHVPDPATAIAEAHRVLIPGGRYYAATAGRANDPEIVPEGYPPTPFDAEEAVDIVAPTFGGAEGRPWDGRFFPLRAREEFRAYCRANFLPPERAEQAELPLWLTKRGVLVVARKGPAAGA